jgi:asparagine synthetase B (glutamine-hydrolysing)
MEEFMSLIFGMVKKNMFICNNSNTYKYKKNTYKIAYDGGIFNSKIIKQELLSKGYYFETNLEDEVILKAFIEFGVDVYSKFSGHFAVVIWNELKNEVAFMKDYYSIKSIYYKKHNDGEIVFSNSLIELLKTNDNVITYDKFVDVYLINSNRQEGFITNCINECAKIMIYSNETIEEINEVNYFEYGYIFDEVAQVVLEKLDKMCIVSLEDKNNEIMAVSEYILEMFNKDKKIISKKFSKEKLIVFKEVQAQKQVYSHQKMLLVLSLKSFKEFL